MTVETIEATELPTPTPAIEPWLTTREAAARAKRHERTVRNALKLFVSSRGKRGLRGHQDGPNCCWRIHVDDIDAWIRGEKPPSTRGRHLGRVS